MGSNIHPKPRYLLHPNCTCGDCLHLSVPEGGQEGFCTPAAEALREEGYARATVLIEPDMSAESCPSFEDRRAVYGPDEAADDAYHAQRDNELCEALKGAA